MSQSLDEFMQNLGAPLREEEAKLQAELDEVNKSREQLLFDLRRVREVIRRIEPPKPRKPKSTDPQLMDVPEARIREVWQFIENRNGELEGGFTPTSLYTKMTANGGSLIGKEPVRRAILQLHDRGLIRLDRRTQGGGKLYKVVSQ